MVSVEKKPSGPFVIAYGGEDFLLDQIVDKGRSMKNRRVFYLDGDGMTDVEFVDICVQRTFESMKKVVVLDNANKLKGDKALTPFIEETDPKDGSVFVFAIIRSEKLPAVWRAAAKKGRTHHFPSFKPWETGKKEARISAEARRLGLTLEASVPGVFLRFLGDDLRRVSNELRKLTFVVEGRPVEPKDVARVLAADKPVQPWEVADAATNKDKRRAMNLLSHLFKTMGDSASIPITAGLVRQVERLILARQMMDKGDEVQVIATRLDMHPFPLQKNVLPRAQKFTVRELRDQMNKLCRLDALVKGPARSKRTHVELAVLSIAA